MPQKETLTEFRLNALVGAVNRLTDVIDDRLTDMTDVLDDPHSQKELGEKLDSITNMLEEIQKKMATQEERLQAIGARLTQVQAGVDAIQAALADLKANNPALEDEISAIEAQVDALGADVASSVGDSKPVDGTPATTGVITGDAPQG